MSARSHTRSARKERLRLRIRRTRRQQLLERRAKKRKITIA